MIDLHNLVQAYISERENFFDRERYKWEAVKSFQEYYKKECYSLENQLRYPFDVANNLLLSHNYYPASMLCTFAREKTDETQACLDKLYDESLPLSERVWAFINGTERIFMTLKEEGFSDWKARTNVQSYQDPHTVSVYLALKFPQKYYIYKWSIFKQAAEKLNYTIKSKDKVSKLLEFYDFCGTIKKAILNEKEFWTKMPLPSVSVSDPLYRGDENNNWSGQAQALTYQRAITALENYGYYSLIPKLGRKLFEAIGEDCIFVQQYDPFTMKPSLEGVSGNQDAYGPAMLAVLEYISRMYGVVALRDRLIWSSVKESTGYYEQHLNGHVYKLEHVKEKAYAFIDERQIGCFDRGVRLETDFEGKELYRYDGL